MHCTTKTRTLTTALVIPLALGLTMGACGNDAGPTGPARILVGLGGPNLP